MTDNTRRPDALDPAITPGVHRDADGRIQPDATEERVEPLDRDTDERDDTVSGAATGTVVGAGLGAVIGGPIGAVVGAIVGARQRQGGRGSQPRGPERAHGQPYRRRLASRTQ